MSPGPIRDVDKTSYLIGFGLAVVLTVIPFAVVYWRLLPVSAAFGVIAVAAIAQIVVQLRFFLHVDFERTPRENLAALFFAGFLILVMVGGSLWIMFDLRYRHSLEMSLASPGDIYCATALPVRDSPRPRRPSKLAATSSTNPISNVSAAVA